MEDNKEKLPYEKATMQIIEIAKEQFIATSGCNTDCNPEIE